MGNDLDYRTAIRSEETQGHQVYSYYSFKHIIIYSVLLCLGAHAQARYTVVCLCVCLSVCLCRLLQLLKDESSASKSFYRLLVMFTWILIRGFAK